MLFFVLRKCITLCKSILSLTLALWFWNHTCTTRTVSPVSAASVSLTCRLVFNCYWNTSLDWLVCNLPQNNNVCMGKEYIPAHISIDKTSWSSYLAARLSRHFKGGLESTPLLCGQDSAWSLWTLVVLAVVTTFPSSRASSTILILTFHWTR